MNLVDDVAINPRMSGASTRLLIALAALRSGETLIDGHESLRARTNRPLVSALQKLGCRIDSSDGHLPLTVRGPIQQTRSLSVDGSLSSQYITALLLISCGIANGEAIFEKITIEGKLVSKPYIDITISAVNGAPYGGGDIPQGATVTYRVSYVNTSLSGMTTVATNVTLPTQVSGTGNFRVVSGADIRPATDPVSGTFALQSLPTLNGLGSGSIEFDAYVTATTGGTLTASASNSSDQGGADTDSVTTNVSGTPVATMPVCDGSRFNAVDWDTDAPTLFGVVNSFSRYGSRRLRCS